MLFSKSTILASVLVATAALVSSTPTPNGFIGTLPRSIQQAEMILRESIEASAGDSVIPGVLNLNHDKNVQVTSTPSTLQPIANAADNTSAAISLHITSFPLIIGVAAIGGFLTQFI